MIHLTRALLRRWLSALLHVDDTPERTAAAFAVGVFFGFSPFLGLHTLLGIVFAFALSLNRVAVLMGVYSNLPWVIAAYYTFTTIVGASITRTRLPIGFRDRISELFDLSLRQPEFWDQLATLLRPFVWPFAIGSLIGAVVLAAVAYPLALGFVKSRKKIQHIIHKH